MNYNIAVLACLTMTINLNTVAAVSLVLAIGALAWDHFYRNLQYIKLYVMAPQNTMQRLNHNTLH